MSRLPPERWARAEEILDAALELPAGERAAYLERACAGDEALRREVDALLAADEAADRAAGGFLERPAAEFAGGAAGRADDDGVDRAAGAREGAASGVARIGRYRIVREIGRGGMGVVYEAEQESPRRAVAVKVILGGAFVDDREVRLFQREAETLGRLRHPGIAAIYEAGRTDEGQHFFAMELVRGDSLDRHLRARGGPAAAESRADLRGRLSLFLEICEPIAYAHQRGVIHRDIKPSNILVTRDEPAADERPRGRAETDGRSAGARAPGARIKVLDFGIARITDPEATLSALTSGPAYARGTLPYMSPEQARGDADAIDVRTDVYSLGVVLYEMLAGARPYDVTRGQPHEAVRTICEAPPRRPSSLAPALAGDVETILLTALETEPARRYQTVAALADDVARFLADEPILARPPSTIYQVRKLVARHRLAFGFMAAIAALLVVFGATMTVLFAQQRRLRARAETEAEKARRTSRFVQDMLSAVSPEKAKGKEVTVREILDEAAARMETELADQPEVAAEIRSTIGRTYLALGHYEAAEPSLRGALETRRRILGESRDVATSLCELGELLKVSGHYAAAESVYTEALAMQRRLLGNEHTDVATTLSAVGLMRHFRADFDGGESALREALAILERALGADDMQVVECRNNLALLLRAKGDYPAAEPLFRENAASMKRTMGVDHPITATCVYNHALVLADMSDYERAKPLYEEALAIQRKVLDGDHPDIAMTLNSMGVMYGAMGDYGAAEPLYREALDMRKRMLGDEHPEVARSMNNLGGFLKDKGDPAAAEPLFRQALAIRRKVLGDDHPDVASSLVWLGLLLTETGRAREAEPMLREAAAIRREKLPAHWRTAEAENSLGACLLELGRYAEAESLLVRSQAALEGDPSPTPRMKKRALERLVLLYERWGRAEAASRYRAML